MRQLKWALATAVILAVPITANAGFVLEGSLGTGYQVSDRSGRIPTSVMVAPGFAFTDMLRLELGFNFPLGDTEFSDFDLQLRPMVVVDPPLLPFYVRAVAAVSNLIADNGPYFAIGGAAGLGFELGGIGIFAEAGAIPYFVESATLWQIEGRAGVYISM